VDIHGDAAAAKMMMTCGGGVLPQSSHFESPPNMKVNIVNDRSDDYEYDDGDGDLDGDGGDYYYGDGRKDVGLDRYYELGGAFTMILF